MHVLPDLQKDAGNTRILADGLRITFRDMIIFHDAAENFLCSRPRLCFFAGLDSFFHILRQIAVGIDAESCHHIRDLCRFDFLHIDTSHIHEIMLFRKRRFRRSVKNITNFIRKHLR